MHEAQQRHAASELGRKALDGQVVLLPRAPMPVGSLGTIEEIGLAIGGIGYGLSVSLARAADLAAGNIELLDELTVEQAGGKAPSLYVNGLA